MPEGADTVRILHVDDEPELADLTATLLERQSDRLCVETAPGADEGLDRLGDGTDCVISDYDMPGMDGIEFLETVREEYPDIPFILFTGKGSEAVASDAISAGITDYLQKGTGMEQYELLCKRIENAVAKRRAQINYRKLFDEMPVGLTMHDPADGVILNANQAFGDLLGYDPVQLEGAHPGELSPDSSPFDREKANQLIQETVENGSRRFEWQDQTKAGDLVWIEVTLERTRIDGRTRVLAAVQETTDRKEREQSIETLHHTAQKLMQADTAQEVAETVAEAMSGTLGMSTTGVWLHDEREDVLRPVDSTDRATEVVGELPTFERGEALAWEVFETGEVRHYGDVSTVDNRYNPDTPIRSELLLPLGDHGIVTTGSTRTDAFTDVDVSLAEILTRHAETALDRVDRETTP